MKSETSKCTINKEEVTRKFIHNLDLLVSHEDNHLFRKVDNETIQEAI